MRTVELIFPAEIRASYSDDGWQCDDPGTAQMLAWYTPEHWAAAHPFQYSPDPLNDVAAWAAESLGATLTPAAPEPGDEQAVY